MGDWVSFERARGGVVSCRDDYQVLEKYKTISPTMNTPHFSHITIIPAILFVSTYQIFITSL